MLFTNSSFEPKNILVTVLSPSLNSSRDLDKSCSWITEYPTRFDWPYHNGLGKSNQGSGSLCDLPPLKYLSSDVVPSIVSIAPNPYSLNFSITFSGKVLNSNSLGIMPRFIKTCLARTEVNWKSSKPFSFKFLINRINSILILSNSS